MILYIILKNKIQLIKNILKIEYKRREYYIIQYNKYNNIK